MAFITRHLAPNILDACRCFPSVVLTGPRRCGKTSLLREMFPRAEYVLLEDPDIRERARSDPRGLLDSLRPPVLFDEIQNVPELFDYIRSRIDLNPRQNGRFLFTGSQEAPLMAGVTESMAGRAALLHLMPLSLSETSRVSMTLGGYPEVIARPAGRNMWFSSYIQTYLERDVRSLKAVRDLGAFRVFFALLASRHGQVLNRTDLSAPLGLSSTTIDHWLHILEVTAQIIIVPPYHNNYGKRLLKSPKVYIGDSGMACHLLGIQTAAELERSPFLGSIYEGFVASEILKSQINSGRRRELYYYRDRQGFEIDFLFPDSRGALNMVECKASRTVKPEMAARMRSLHRNIAETAEPKLPVKMTVVHRASSSTPAMTALAPGVTALTTEAFVAELNKAPRARTAGR